jgi:hypothetical protein
MRYFYRDLGDYHKHKELLELAFPIFDKYKYIYSIVPELREMVNVLNSIAPLHYAAQQGILDAVRSSLNESADVNKINNQGATTLCLAAENGHRNIFGTVLKVTDINMNVKTDTGVTQLHYAAQNGNAEIIKLLLKMVQILKLLILMFRHLCTMLLTIIA